MSRSRLALRRRSFKATLTSGRFWIVAVALIAFSELLHFLPMVKRGSLDWLDILQAVAGPVTPHHCVLVGIDSSDFAQLFGRRKPYSPNVLVRIIREIGQFRPRVIAVDLDTSDPVYAELAGVRLPDVAIVWARSGTVKRDGDSKVDVVPDAVLGSTTSEPEWSGVAMFPREVDWQIRRPERRVPHGSRYLDTFYWAIVRAYCAQDPKSQCVEDKDTSAKSRSDYFAHQLALTSPDYIPARSILSNSSQPAPNSIFADRIVLIGGTSDDCDVHVTPVGEQRGLFITAAAVEEELSGTRISEVGRGYIWVLKLFLCFGTAGLFHFFRPTIAAIAAFLLSATLAIGVSGFSFFGHRIWLDVVVVGCGMIIEVLLELLYVAENASEAPT